MMPILLYCPFDFENLTSARGDDSLFVVMGGGNSELEAGRSPAAKKANSYKIAICVSLLAATQTGYYRQQQHDKAHVRAAMACRTRSLET